LIGWEYLHDFDVAVCIIDPVSDRVSAENMDAKQPLFIVSFDVVSVVRGKIPDTKDTLTDG
jgi:hypothetical protein